MKRDQNQVLRANHSASVWLLPAAWVPGSWQLAVGSGRWHTETRAPSCSPMHVVCTLHSSRMGDAVENLGEIGAQQLLPHQEEVQIGCGSERSTPQDWMEDLKFLEDASNEAGFPQPPAVLYPLHSASAIGRADIVEYMLDLGSYDKNGRDETERTPLHHAAMVGNIAAANTLLSAGADVTLLCSTARSALDVAVDKRHVEIAKMIIDHGADVNGRDVDGRTLLQIAVAEGEAEMVSLLCRKGAAIDVFDGVGRTALHLATIREDVAVMQILIAAGARVNLRTELSGKSALGIAAARGNLDVVQALVERGADVNATANQDNETALHAAAAHNRPAVIDMLIGSGASIEPDSSEGHSPLHCATQNSSLEAVIALLKHGASVGKQDILGATPLHFAATNAGEPRVAEIVELLLEHGADETVTTVDGSTVADLIGVFVEARNSLAEEVECVRKLLAKAPAERAWRRRGFLIMCRVHFPSGRVRLGQEGSSIFDGMATMTLNGAEPSWAGVASMLMGAGADPISLMGSGADFIFETVVGYL